MFLIWARTFALLFCVIAAIRCTSSESSLPSSARASGSATTSPITDLTAVERRVHELVNQERERKDLAPLDWNGQLEKIARRHSDDMASRQFFAHDSPEGQTPSDRARQAGFQCHVALDERRTREGIGENIFSAYLFESYEIRYVDGEERIFYSWKSVDNLAMEIVSSWMSSRGHRRNILRSDYSEEGIGIIVNDEQQVYVTQNFC